VSNETTNETVNETGQTTKPKRKYTPRDQAARARAQAHRERAARLRKEADVQDKLAEVEEMVAGTYADALSTSEPESTPNGSDPFAG
jgi:hypothetical protein